MNDQVLDDMFAETDPSEETRIREETAQLADRAIAGPEASPRQRSYLFGLANGKDLTPLTDVQRDWLESQVAMGEEDGFKIPKFRASNVIESLKQLVWKPRETQPAAAARLNLPFVADGRYAVHDPMNTTGQPLSFFKVKNGRYQTFLDVYASDSRHPINKPEHLRAVLLEIEKDPVAAMKLFGSEMGKCGRCGRSLTDETSRAFGIGPDCREIMGI